MSPFWPLLAFAYFLGSIPVGVLIARAKGVDLRKVGSGNIGATNVNRALGKGWGVFVFLLDMMKAVIPSVIARMTMPTGEFGLDVQVTTFLIGTGAILGHVTSPFLGFRGGKGVSTAMGAGIVAAPVVALTAFALFAVVLATTRYMAVASIVGVCSATLFGLLFPGQSLGMIPFYIVIGGLVTWLHRGNIARLRAGTESKFAFSKSKAAEATIEPR